jgi:5'-deoxynucleotidase YfbR-like HD superfamily hydrolase
MIGWDGDYAELMRYALCHDLDETVTGDIPGPAKRLAWDKGEAEDALRGIMTDKYGCDVVDARSSAPGSIRAIVSVADSIDEVCYLTEEILSGNRWVDSVRREAMHRLESRWWNLPGTYRHLDEIWTTKMAALILIQEIPPVLLEDRL